MIHTLPLDFVSVRLLELLSTNDSFQLSRFSSLSDDRDVHLLLLLGRESSSSFGGLLLVVSILVSPLNVLRGGLLEMFFDVVEGVLGDVSDSQIRVLLDSSAVRERLSSEKFDKSRLSSSVGTDCMTRQTSVMSREGRASRRTHRYRLGKKETRRRRRC